MPRETAPRPHTVPPETRAALTAEHQASAVSLHTLSSGTRLSTGISHTCDPRAALLPLVTWVLTAGCMKLRAFPSGPGCVLCVDGELRGSVRGTRATRTVPRARAGCSGRHHHQGVCLAPACLPAETTTKHPVCGAPVALQREKDGAGRPPCSPAGLHSLEKEWRPPGHRGATYTTPRCRMPTFRCEENGGHFCGFAPESPRPGLTSDKPWVGLPRPSLSPEQAPPNAPREVGPGLRGTREGNAASVVWRAAPGKPEAATRGSGVRGPEAPGTTSLPLYT